MKRTLNILVCLSIFSLFLHGEEINGYSLPLEPNISKNNSTLLGIDTNNNSVRDDLERKIIQMFKGDKIYIESTFQMMKAYTLILNFHKEEKNINNVLLQASLAEISAEQCALSIRQMRYRPKNGLNRTIRFSKHSIFNTPERKKAYAIYAKAKPMIVLLLQSKELTVNQIEKISNKKHDLKYLQNQCTFDLMGML